MGSERPRRPRRKRSPRRPKPDGRRWVVRRAKAIAAAFHAQLGARAREPSVALSISKAAELAALAADARSRALRGDPTITADDLVRLGRLATSAERALHLPEPTDARAPSLQEYLASRTARPADAVGGDDR
jgi:hypothetical protein